MRAVTAVPMVWITAAMFLIVIGLDTLVRQRRSAAPRQPVLYAGVLMVVAGLLCACWCMHG